MDENPYKAPREVVVVNETEIQGRQWSLFDITCIVIGGGAIVLFFGIICGGLALTLPSRT